MIQSCVTAFTALFQQLRGVSTSVAMDSYGGGRYEDSGERGDRDKRLAIISSGPCPN